MPSLFLAPRARRRQEVLSFNAGATALRLAAALCCLPLAAAHAAPEEGLHPFAALGYSYDDNLFRLSEGNPGYDNRRGDSSRQLQAGVQYNHRYGRQDISLLAKASKVGFGHFKQLDYTGKDASAQWDWHVGNDWDGSAGLRYNEVLAPYTDVVTSERNLRVQRGSFLSAFYHLTPSWRLRAGVTRDKYSYELTSMAASNHVDDSLESGVDYFVSSGSSLGVQARKIKRKYDQPGRRGGVFYDNGSDQDELKLKAYWRATPVTDLQFLGGWARRTHPALVERDASGINARLSGNTLLDGKVGMNAAVWREFSGVESNIVSYSLNTGASVGLNYVLSAKVQAGLQSKYEKRSFRGLLAASIPVDLDDSTHTHSLSLNYAPLRAVQLSASLFRESRGGLAVLGNSNYRSTGASLNVNLQY